MNKKFTDKKLCMASKNVWKNCFYLRDNPQNCRFKQSWEDTLGPSNEIFFSYGTDY